VTVAKVRGKRRYFPGREADPALAAALDDRATRRVLEALASVGPAPTGRVADAVDRDVSTVSHHLDGLEDDDLVVREREGRAMYNRLEPRVERALGAEEPEPAVADD